MWGHLAEPPGEVNKCSEVVLQAQIQLPRHWLCWEPGLESHGAEGDWGHPESQGPAFTGLVLESSVS